MNTIARPMPLTLKTWQLRRSLQRRNFADEGPKTGYRADKARLQAERRAMVDRRAALRSKLTEADIHDADMERLTGMWSQQIALLTELLLRSKPASKS